MRLGRATALALARAGYDVIVHANRSRAPAEDVAREVSATGRRAWVEAADLAVVSDVRALASRVASLAPDLALVVHNAGAYEHKAFAEVSPEDLDRMMAVNVRAPFLLTQALLPQLRASGAGCVIHVTDMAVSHAYTTSHAFSHYVASKAALDQLTRSLALELGPDVRVNAVAPGPVAMADETTSAERAEILARVPLRREGSPEDVARAVVFLAQAAYVTGQTLRVDGGLSVT